MSIRTDLNGLRIQKPGHAEIFLIVEGTRRLIPNPVTYENLFLSWNGITQDVNIDDIDRGADLTDKALLARERNITTVFLITNDSKFGIPSEQVFNQFYFSWDKVWELPPVALGAIPDGGVLNGR